MKIYVCVKQVPDTSGKVAVNPDGTLDVYKRQPMIRPSINCVAMTYALAQDPQYAELMTVKSSLTGHTINRFTQMCIRDRVITGEALHDHTGELILTVEEDVLIGDEHMVQNLSLIHI